MILWWEGRLRKRNMNNHFQKNTRGKAFLLSVVQTQSPASHFRSCDQGSFMVQTVKHSLTISPHLSVPKWICQTTIQKQDSPPCVNVKRQTARCRKQVLPLLLYHWVRGGGGGTPSLAVNRYPKSLARGYFLSVVQTQFTFQVMWSGFIYGTDN